MKRVKGRQLYVFADGYPIICSTDCNLSISASTLETSSAKGARRFRAGKKSWSMNCAGFYVKSAAIPANIVQGVLAVGSTVRVAMTALAREFADAGIDIATISPDATHTIVGEAIITSCQYVGRRSGLATYSIAFQGSGKIAPPNAVSAGFPYALPVIF